MSARAPRLETARLILRERRLEDFPAYAAMWADPRVAEHIVGRASTREESWMRFTRMAGIWALVGYGFWIVEDRAGRFVGEVGFADFKRDIEPSLDGALEFGWIIAGEAQGRGYASEAAQAAIDWAATAFPSMPMRCIIKIGNAPSERVAEKLGFAPLARALHKDAQVTVFAR